MSFCLLLKIKSYACFTGDQGDEFDDSDRDRNFLPDTSDESGDASSSNSTIPEVTGRTKKRMRKREEWKRLQAKRKRNSGKEYEGRKGELHVAKQVKHYPHTCRYECKNISENDRLNVFKEFWDLGNWNLQTSFLQSCIGVSAPHRRVQVAIRHKRFSTTINLTGKRVCKQFFFAYLRH